MGVNNRRLIGVILLQALDRRRHRVCPGRRSDRSVFRAHQPDHAPGRAVHALGGSRRRRRRRARDRFAGQPPQPAPGALPGAGHRFSRCIMRIATNTRAIAEFEPRRPVAPIGLHGDAEPAIRCRGLAKTFGSGGTRVQALSRRRSGGLTGRDHAAGRPLRLRQDDADLDHRRPARSLGGIAARAGQRPDRARLRRPSSISAHEISDSSFSSTTCSPRSARPRTRACRSWSAGVPRRKALVAARAALRTRWASTSVPTPFPRNSPADSSSAWRSPGRSFTSHDCSCATSRPPRSTPRLVRR